MSPTKVGTQVFFLYLWTRPNSSLDTIQIVLVFDAELYSWQWIQETNPEFLVPWLQKLLWVMTSRIHVVSVRQVLDTIRYLSSNEYFWIVLVSESKLYQNWISTEIVLPLITHWPLFTYKICVLQKTRIYSNTSPDRWFLLNEVMSYRYLG